MNRPVLLSMALAAVFSLSCGGKVLVDGLGSNGEGGAGGAGAGGHPTAGSTGSGTTTTTTTTTSSSKSSGSASSSSSGVGGGSSSSGGPCDMALTCQDAITPGVGNPAKLCAGSPEKAAYDALHACSCNPGGKCQAKCGADPWCKGMGPSAGCGMCIIDLAVGCGNEFTTCNM